MAEGVFEPADAPAVLLVSHRANHFASGGHRTIKHRMRIVDGKHHAHRAAAQRSAMQQLNRDLEAIYRNEGLMRGPRREIAPPLETAPRKHHTLEDFAANLPDFGDSSSLNPSQSQSQALARPRR